MNRFVASAVMALGIATFTSSARADENDWGWHMWGWRNGHMPGFAPIHGMMSRMGIVDANDDGAISADEAAVQVGNVFSIMDANDDGDITGEEFSDFVVGNRWGWLLKAERQAAVLTDKKNRFFTMDSDKNGKVSEEEFFAAGQKRFSEADKDKDGKVTPWEFRAQRWW